MAPIRIRQEIFRYRWKKSTKVFESKMRQRSLGNKSVVLQPLICSDHFILEQYPNFLYIKNLDSCWALTAVTPSNTDTWSGVPSHVTGQQDSWGLPAPAPAVAPSEASWGGDDWSSEDESVRDTRLMPPPSAAVSRQPPQLQQAGQRVLYANNFHTARWASLFYSVFPILFYT